MRRLLTMLALAVGLIGLGVCSGAQAAQTAPIRVVAAETFLADIAQNVAGDRAHVDALMPFLADPHEFQPTPSDVKKVAECQVLILNGGGLEEYQKRLIENAGGERVVVEACRGLANRKTRELEPETDEGEEAVLSDADIADSIARAFAGQRALTVFAGKDAASAGSLPKSSGLFQVKLVALPDGSFGGYIACSPDDSGDFQIATGSGEAKVLMSDSLKDVAAEKTLELHANGLTRGYVVQLEKGGNYVLSLSGSKSPDTLLLIGLMPEALHYHPDPHFWLDPMEVIQYVANIRDGLTQADPEGAATYARNAEVYTAKLRELDAWIAEQVRRIPPERRLMVTSHDEFGYFADRYGLTVVGAIIPSTSTEASTSAKQLAALVDQIRATHAPAIFLEPEANMKLAEQVSHETGIKMVTDLHTHSTTDPSGPAPTYIQMMRYNVTKIVDGLLPAGAR